MVSIFRESRHQAVVKLGLSVSTNNRMPPKQYLPVPVHGDYQLPYPGILPNDPFYMMKMIRDRIRLLTTINPESKTRLLFSYANQRIAAAKALGEEGNIDEALTVASKAEAYLFQSIMRSQTIPIFKQTQWFEELKQATLKHEEVIEELNLIAPNFANNQATRLHDGLDQLREQIVALSGQPFGYLRPEDNAASPSSELQEPRF